MLKKQKTKNKTIRGFLLTVSLRSAHRRGLLPWRVYTRGLVIGTCPMNSSHQAFWGTSRRDLSQKFKPVWTRGTSRRDQILVPATRFCGKLASSHNGTCPHNLLPSCVPTFIEQRKESSWHNFCKLYSGRIR